MMQLLKTKNELQIKTNTAKIAFTCETYKRLVRTIFSDVDKQVFNMSVNKVDKVSLTVVSCDMLTSLVNWKFFAKNNKHVNVLEQYFRSMVSYDVS